MAVVNIFMHHLSMAICEWFLMFLMFFDATLGFILTKFAHHCELQTPCLFCYKFDHVFGEKPGYYLNFFCKKHRDEVSCLITCEIHEKLADVREMCDDCFISIMKQNELSKRYLSKNFVRKPSSLGLCSCCKIQWKPKPRPPMPRVTGRAKSRGSFRRRNNFKRVRDKISGTSSTFYIGDKIHMDTVSDSGCADFYSGSDSESEDSFYEIDCGETECYEPSFRKGSRYGSDKHEGYEYSETRSVGEHDVEKLDETHEREGYEHSETHSVGETEVENFTEKLNSPHNGSDKREGYEYSETHSVGDIENVMGKLNGSHNGLDKHEGYEYSVTHSVGEMDGKNDVEKINGPHNGSDKHEGYEYSETLSVGEMDGENDMEKINSPHNGSDKNEGYEYSETDNAGDGEDVENINSPRSGSNKHEGYEYSETQSVSEIDGENDVEILKRKLENEQQRLRLLHKELEEERNASAIAADEAMAMITRLQEEKAALHMEASQYLRMMDEQAEYDMDALDKANDLVTEKDKEIQDLEAELEYFRNRYENELFSGNFKSFKRTKSVLGLEDEKNYILKSLSELERKYDQNYKDSMELNGGESEVDVENEIAGLNERLEALESDRDFIEHACNMVESHGDVQFIQEIAQHLRDLRRARFD